MRRTKRASFLLRPTAQILIRRPRASSCCAMAAFTFKGPGRNWHIPQTHICADFLPDAIPDCFISGGIKMPWAPKKPVLMRTLVASFVIAAILLVGAGAAAQDNYEIQVYSFDLAQ